MDNFTYQDKKFIAPDEFPSVEQIRDSPHLVFIPDPKHEWVVC